ncbi:hypothetical protein CcaverHIS002_0302220 [Cutaneotrichosporon cavernicola]|nr:hypothetical protein CcaverHIS002_0302220 [Cutaneotrichosporon cavernicola]BEI97927.1 hypothetical protein CcaverHIS631_0302260 [Cutaneotrichosporon cavernicola]BEJ05706.1 hypothetical protein CcaverHIS641_0302280 [Cutaneotrichosporon cavernicola]
MTAATTNLWSTPKAGPSQLGPAVTHTRTRTPNRPGPQAAQETSMPSDSTSTYSASLHSASASVHSGLGSGRNLSNLFLRRGSLPRTAKSVRSGQSSSGFEDDVEMMPLPRKKRIQEHHGARIDRRKADAAVSKWRKWIVEQPQQAAGEASAASASSFLFHTDGRSGDTESNPTPPSTIGRCGPRDLSAHGSFAGPSSSGSVPWNASGPSSETSHPCRTLKTPVPFALDIYTTESVRALHDVELAVDPAWLEASVAPRQVRRLSTHPRVSPEMENPFAAIDTLLSRRRIRPLVLELVQALGSYIDAVWCTTYPDRPCPWSGVPSSRRGSLASNAKGWKSWTITAVQEGKRLGLLNSPPTAEDVAFYGREIRYGLRDIDEAVNRRKDLGWAFGETVVRGGYGDIVPSNVLTDGRAGNIPRLLNDLEEALWGDALPAPSDLAFEHDRDFDPFSVYREGDELIGVQHQASSDRDMELRKLFSEYYPSGENAQHPNPTDVPGLSCSPRSRFDESLHTPVDDAVPTMAPVPELDFAIISVLQEMSREEQLELGRRRHQEYLRKRSELQTGGEETGENSV